MSRTMHVRGRIKRYQRDGESLLDCAKRAAGKLADAIKDDNDAEDAFYFEPLEDKYMLIGGIVFEKLEFSSKEFEGDMVDISTKDGVVAFNLIFYNGGGCEQDILSDYLNKRS